MNRKDKKENHHRKKPGNANYDAAIEPPAYFLKRKLAANAIIIIGMSRYSSITKNLKNYLKFPPSA